MDGRTDRQIFFIVSTCEQTHLKAASPSTLYSYVTNGLDIESKRSSATILSQLSLDSFFRSTLALHFCNIIVFSSDS